MLDREVRLELRSLSRETADLVARHLVVTGQLLDVDAEAALQHARAARALAGRVGAVREAGGLAAYAAGEWAEALTELRAARRISGSPEHLAVMADCERALGRPERALAYADDPDVPRLEQGARVELVIVLSGARRDLGQVDAAVLALQDPARRTRAGRPWAVRLWYAYADALLTAGREADAREWFAAAAQVDTEGETDAAERLLELDGVVFAELEDGEDGDVPPAPPRDVDRRPAAEDQAPEERAGAAATAPATAEPEPVVAVPAREPEPVAEPAPEPEPASEQPADQGEGGEPVARRTYDAVPGVSFQAPDAGEELRLFD